jgi:predicted naringenin-chalcone synthase
MSIVSAAIFGDGAACVYFLLTKMKVPKFSGRNVSFYENEHMMGFKLTNTGLQMILDIEVPDTISHFPAIIHPFKNLKIDMDHLIFHPGGKNSANSRSIVFGFGQKYRGQSFTFVRKYVECNRVCFGTIYGQ